MMTNVSLSYCPHLTPKKLSLLISLINTNWLLSIPMFVTWLWTLTQPQTAVFETCPSHTLTCTSRQRAATPSLHLSQAPPSCSISGLDWASQGAGASPRCLWLNPSLHHLFSSSASDSRVKDNTTAWWIGLFMDASLPGRLLILQSAPVYLLFTQTFVIQLRS